MALTLEEGRFQPGPNPGARIAAVVLPIQAQWKTLGRHVHVLPRDADNTEFHAAVHQDAALIQVVISVQTLGVENDLVHAVSHQGGIEYTEFPRDGVVVAPAVLKGGPDFAALLPHFHL